MLRHEIIPRLRVKYHLHEVRSTHDTARIAAWNARARGREKFGQVDGPQHPCCKPAHEMSVHLHVPSAAPDLRDAPGIAPWPLGSTVPLAPLQLLVALLNSRGGLSAFVRQESSGSRSQD